MLSRLSLQLFLTAAPAPAIKTRCYRYGPFAAPVRC